jgi:UTP---glucose-1-phosphate uridylyltransferase
MNGTLDANSERMEKGMDEILEKIARLEPICNQIKDCGNIYEKINILHSDRCVKAFFIKHPFFEDIIEGFLPEEMLAVLSVIFLGVADYLFFPWQAEDEQFRHTFRGTLDHLLDIEKFYDVIGGIVGYHLTVLKLIVDDRILMALDKKVVFHTPPSFTITEENEGVRKAILRGIKELEASTWILPVGGAGDRLNLCDEITGEPLPVARLLFGGMNLLEGIIRDLQALEYLHYKIEGRQLMMPIVMMTSQEKNNYRQLVNICEKARWFGRQRHCFFLFVQPLTPVVNDLGEWAIEAPLKPILKPGGHGVVWKLIQDRGVFDILVRDGIKYAIVRQVNNPLAGLDHGILSLLGYGVQEKKVFGFASCERLVKSSEGMDLLLEIESPKGFDYAISNVEYTQFAKRGIEDIPRENDSPYSSFPTNTNILFAEIQSLRKRIPENPIPGMLINMKHQFPTHDGQQRFGGRLESTMQNIADVFTTHSAKRIQDIHEIDFLSFMTYNDRKKTISVTKKSYCGEGSISETPEGALYDLQQVYAQLFGERCHFKLPPPQTEEEFIAEGPRTFISFHPALGPLWSVIEQKIQGGSLAAGSELHLNVAEARIQNLNLKGSLIVEASAVMGEKNSQEILTYSEFSGKIELIDVTVDNRGINRAASNNYWKQQIHRHEALKIILYGTAEFFASGMTFRGGTTLIIPDGHRMIAQEKGGEVIFRTEKIANPSWWWKYQAQEDGHIKLQLS